MVENDTVSDHVNKPFIEQKSRAVHSLITEERTRKLELLIHLISNSRQALVVCGPEGIGKSTLLKVFQESKIESWLYCLVHGNKDLSFDKIQEQAAQVIMQDKQVRDLSDVFRLVESQHKKIVLMLDDAGDLAPGLINTIIDYAAKNPVLKVIFILTHDDLFVKNSSDSAIDDCHLIEIPPLSETQCGEFLQYLATNPRSKVAFNTISDGMAEAIYRDTRGIPGQIIAKLPGFEAVKQSHNPLRNLVAAVAALVTLALVIQWFSASKYNIKQMSTDVQSSADTKIVAPQSQPTPPPAHSISNAATISEQPTEIGNLTESKTNSAESKAETDGQLLTDSQQLNDTQQKVTESLTLNNEQAKDLDDSKAVNNTALSTSKIIHPQQTAPTTDEQIAAAVNQNDGEQWLMTQPIENYTLQVMVLSKEQSMKNILKKYPQLVQNLRYIKTVAHDKARFVLLYGSFTSLALANESRKSLPSEFHNSVAIKISAIKK